jgi:hypothetical protein
MRTSLLPDHASVKTDKRDNYTAHQHQSTDPGPLIPSLSIISPLSQNADIATAISSGENPNTTSFSTFSTSSFTTSNTTSHGQCSVLEDLISFASAHLVPNGRLVFWWPEGTYMSSYDHFLHSRSLFVRFASIE